MPQLMIHHARLGLIDKDVFAIDKAAREYDERLSLDRHPDTGDWVVCVAVENSEQPYPVLGLGKTVPSVSEFLTRLRASDTQRNDIRAQVNDVNTRIHAEADRKTAQETGQAAEVGSFIVRKQMGDTSTSYRKIVKS